MWINKCTTIFSRWSQRNLKEKKKKLIRSRRTNCLCWLRTLKKSFKTLISATFKKNKASNVLSAKKDTLFVQQKSSELTSFQQPATYLMKRNYFTRTTCTLKNKVQQVQLLLIASISNAIKTQSSQIQMLPFFNSSPLSIISKHLIHNLKAKKPKAEWEGALIRNSEAKCNNWFPIKGAEIDGSSMDSALKKYQKGIG